MGGGASTLVDAEKTSWVRPHRLDYLPALRNEQIKLLDKFGPNLKLCFRNNELAGLGEKYSYQHWWITDGTWTLEFGGGANLGHHVLVHCNPKTTGHSEAEFQKTPDVLKRMRLVCGASNYSLALRNCEHVARYIYTGSWRSGQMDDSGVLKGFFFNYMSQHTKLINTLPMELRANKVDINRKPALYPGTPRAVTFKKTLDMLSEADQASYNIIVLGPTGAGKSTIVNNLFNKAVCETAASVHSVTKHVNFYQGHYAWATTGAGSFTQTVNIIDTLGFCDSLMNADDVLNAIQGTVKVNLTYIDKIVIVCSGRIEKCHSESIKQFLEWLNFKNYRDKFVFVYNKADMQSQDDRINNLHEMCSIFGADINQCTIQKRNDEDLLIKMNLTTGFPPSVRYREVREDHMNLTSACLCLTNLPGGNVKERRIPVDKSSCIIL